MQNGSVPYTSSSRLGTLSLSLVGVVIFSADLGSKQMCRFYLLFRPSEKRKLVCSSHTLLGNLHEALEVQNSVAEDTSMRCICGLQRIQRRGRSRTGPDLGPACGRDRQQGTILSFPFTLMQT